MSSTSCSWGRRSPETTTTRREIRSRRSARRLPAPGGRARRSNHDEEIVHQRRFMAAPYRRRSTKLPSSHRYGASVVAIRATKAPERSRASHRVRRSCPLTRSRQPLAATVALLDRARCENPRSGGITHGQLLKLAGLIDSGAEAKAFLRTEQVSVNGEPEARRGKKLTVGDVVRAGEVELRLTGYET